MKKQYDVAAYIWPAYTGDEPRTRMFWPEGIGEWESVKNAEKKHPGHTWPRRPLWGYVNEADPYVMEMQIEAAVDHGVNVFIYDWYWYDRRPFLENCLNDGFLKAKNSQKMKFYLMWANHNASYLWDKRLSGAEEKDTVIWRGDVDLEEFKRLSRRNIEKYFKLPNYYCIDGKPVFMIYDAMNFVQGIGSLKAAREALDWLREEAVRCGLPGIHLQVALRKAGQIDISGVGSESSVSEKEFYETLGFDSASHQQTVCFAEADCSYPEWHKASVEEWNRLDKLFDFSYFAHVSVGWDNNPRYHEYIPCEMTETTPENIEKALRAAKKYADEHPGQPPLITVNSWNEWTETSYLEPDDVNGYGYLEAVRRVFIEE